MWKCIYQEVLFKNNFKENLAGLTNYLFSKTYGFILDLNAHKLLFHSKQLSYIIRLSPKYDCMSMCISEIIVAADEIF